MSNKNKKIAGWGFYILIGVLLVFAASRTLHFVQMVMDNAIQGYMFLFATGLGSVIWLYVYLNWAEGSSQRAIAFCMTIADLIGELVLTYADMQYVGDKAGLVKMTENEMSIFFTVSVIAVGVNIIAGVFFKLEDLKAKQEQHAQDLVDHVTDETMKHLNTPEAKSQLVQDLLPIYRQAIAGRVAAEIFSRASQTQGLDAKAVGWPLPKQQAVSAVTIPLPSITPEKNDAWLNSLPRSQRNSIIPWHCETCDGWYVSDVCPKDGTVAPELRQKDEQPTASAPFPGQTDRPSGSGPDGTQPSRATTD